MNVESQNSTNANFDQLHHIPTATPPARGFWGGLHWLCVFCV